MSTKNHKNEHSGQGGRIELRREYVYSTAECAELLHLSVRVIRAAIKRGELTAAKIANQFIILGCDVSAYIRRHRVYRGDGKR